MEEHCEMAGMQYEVLETVATPDVILAGNSGEYLAVRKTSETKYIVVVYKEYIEVGDGFIITAFITGRTGSLDRRKIVWP